MSSPVINDKHVKHKNPVVWEKKEERRSVTGGFVNGTPVKVLRDTGSSMVVVMFTLASKRTG